jgi:hypothetical protein
MIIYGVPQLSEECCVDMCVPEMFTFNWCHTLHHSIKTPAHVFRPERRFEMRRMGSGFG